MSNILSYLQGKEGENLWSPCYGEVKYLGSGDGETIVIESLTNGKKHTLKSNGCHLTSGNSGICMLYPNEAGYQLGPDKAWELWKLSPEEEMWEQKLKALQGCGWEDQRLLAQLEVLSSLLGRKIPGEEIQVSISVEKVINGVPYGEPGKYSRKYKSTPEATSAARELRKLLDTL